jgi:hypothetical protein
MPNVLMGRRDGAKSPDAAADENHPSNIEQEQ